MHRDLIESLESRQLLATSHGLSVTYFNNPDFTGTTAHRTESSVNLNVGGHRSPASGIKGTTFSVRWSGLIRPAKTETYTFSVRNNDGVRLWLDGHLIIDAWKSSARKTHTGSMKLLGKHYYDLRLEYFDAKRTAAASLSWQSASTPKQVVPSSKLYPYDTRFAAIGDFGFTNAQAKDTASRVHQWDSDYVVSVGDNSYSGNYSKDVGSFYSDYVGKDVKSNRFYTAIGNHDADTRKAYLNYFALPGNERYYDFVKGPVHFFVLDSDPTEPDGTSPDSKQGQWLKAALAKSTSTYNVVDFHHAAYSSGNAHGDTEYMQWPFKDWGADVVLAGHDHDYERLSEDNIPYFVDGAGAGHRGFNDPVPGSRFRDDTDSGALLIQANAQAMTFTYENRSKGVIDHYTITPRQH